VSCFKAEGVFYKFILIRIFVMDKTVLVMGGAEDPHVQHMYHAIKDSGQKCHLLDTRQFPSLIHISWVAESSTVYLTVPGGDQLKFTDISAVYWRTINKIEVPKTGMPDTDALAYRDCMSTLRTLLNGCNARWVNSWQAYQYHQEKPLQLAKVAELGVMIPKSLISNAPSQVKNFVKSVPRAIYKPVYGGAHTEFLDESMLDIKRLEKVLSISPVTIQEYISGTNIRSYVIGDKIYSAELKSPSVDFRDDDTTQLIPLELPQKVSQWCLKIRQTLGLEWTAIDWRRNDQGQYYFLEANPSPMFLHFEKQTNMPITKALVDLLLL